MRRNPGARQNSPVVMALVSGKGGVGKSVLTVNLGYLLARQGMRTLLIDADPFGSLPHLTNCPVQAGTLRQVTECLELTTDSGLVAELCGSTPKKHECVLIDCAPGLTETVLAAAERADIVALVTIPELTSLAGNYQLFKELSSLATSDCGLLVNRAASIAEGYEIHERFGLLCRQFLATAPTSLGTVLEDSLVTTSVQRQVVLANSHPNTRMVMSLAEVVAGLIVRRSLGRQANALADDVIESPASADTREYCPYGH